MQRPDIERYEAMAAAATATVGPWDVMCRGTDNDWDVFGPDGGMYRGMFRHKGDAELIAASRTAIPELCAYAKHLETLLRDWLDACPETCGQCEVVRERARWTVYGERRTS